MRELVTFPAYKSKYFSADVALVHVGDHDTAIVKGHLINRVWC